MHCKSAIDKENASKASHAIGYVICSVDMLEWFQRGRSNSLK